MRSNFEKIGSHIRLVDERDRDLKVKTLLGLTIDKLFIPSVANTIGSDMANYKIIRKGQFACSLMQVRRDKKIPVALLTDLDEAIISQAYPIFEIIDPNKLLPEYLMMWMRRTEFDREACFYAVGGVRGSLEWEDFCNMELPVPSPKKQRETVEEYYTIIDRIELNERLTQTLGEAAQTIYKQWFVDFEFPISAEYADAIGKPELEGQPYKSCSGEMEYNKVLEQEIPKRWEDCMLSARIEFKNGKTRPTTKGNIPVYGGNGILDYTSKHNHENVVAIGRVGAYCGSLHRIIDRCWISDNAICAKAKDDMYGYSYYLLKTLHLNERSEGTGQPLLTQDLLNAIQTVKADAELEGKFDGIAFKIDRMLALKRSEIDQLRNLSASLLSSLAQKQ
jgi:type I restriction enzyme S subunit